ncbi:paired amphipathic helix protein Sin3 [Trifolium repens]|nr:paired amphipathic helix protein Sin3 [Trifolium repens]KAK2428537.1 paired amphipathic helix protein Sin3 [Trifolium repens]
MACLMSRVKELFKGHKELLVKFNTFLPDDVEYSEVTFQSNKSDDEYDEVSSQPRKSNVNLEYAVKYLRGVKNRFQDEPHIYQSFIDIVNMYRYQNKSADDIWHMVISLFEGHQDLIDGFIVFVE